MNKETRKAINLTKKINLKLNLIDKIQVYEKIIQDQLKTLVKERKEILLKTPIEELLLYGEKMGYIK